MAAAFSEETLEKRLLGNMLFNFIGRPDFISYEEADAKKPMRRLVTLLGAFPVGWTYRSPEQLKKTKKDFRAWIFENFRP